jgi:hypothetical protein
MSCDPNTLLQEAKCFQCLDHHQLMMVKSQLLCSIASQPAVVPPVLSFSFPNLSWTFSGTNPGVWSIQESDDFGANWDEVNQVPGVSRSALFIDSGVLARIVGLFPDVPPSNTVAIP